MALTLQDKIRQEQCGRGVADHLAQAQPRCPGGQPSDVSLSRVQSDQGRLVCDSYYSE